MQSCGSGEAAYAEFVRRLNIMFDRYANTLALRRGIAKAETEKKKAAAEAAGQNTEE